ncbi:hypothetical protein [Sphingomonas oligophenolica]|uniref:Uncharacterized protein n=1 Tax=Sphingomonas oligophenolica TaxID=301154 RepID=A0A502CN99_9SPHN|nr:hypothetical protein [Sphingomonas oligophenolica]TPG13161.1 hypothetical protein EAH84_07105 [Sphingomonas oligophenolica]
MDTTGGFDNARTEIDDATDGAVEDQVFDLGGDERRMHVRAYNHWVSLLHGAPFPAIDRLDPDSITDFGPHSVLLDFGHGIEDPTIAFLGAALRLECGLDAAIRRVAEVPSRSLLSRLTDHYLQIIANRAPIGFEAEFVGNSGCTTLYRGILMPFSSNGVDIDFIYGVINWKVMADADTQATLTAELDAAVRTAPTTNDIPVWADGPSAGLDDRDEDDAEVENENEDPDRMMPPAPTGALGDRLAMARESAAQVRGADARGRAALYRALGRAHDFALAADADEAAYRALLDDALITAQARAPMTPIVKLVFGAEYDKTRLAEYAAVLSHARRHAVAAAGLGAFLEGFAGGIKAIVAAERAARRPAPRPDLYARAAAELRTLPVLATVPIGAGDGEFVVLVARAGRDGTLDIVQRIDQPALVETVVKRAAA